LSLTTIGRPFTRLLVLLGVTPMDGKTRCSVLLQCPFMGGSPIQARLIRLTMACLAYVRGRPLKMYRLAVDDTFSFLDHEPRRRRVDSDASSFYFRTLHPPHTMQPRDRGHRRRESSVSIAPPISLYNCSLGVHRRSDSNMSVSSVAHSYALYGANGGCAVWVGHRQDASVDSVQSDFSATRLGRPGIGDKMFDTAADQGMPLTLISVSPPESLDLGRRGNFPIPCLIQFLMMNEGRRCQMDDSLFDKMGHRSSMSSDSVFGYDDSHPEQGHLLPLFICMF
jgi:serine/arginine repetitive matrix protein 2